MTKLFEEEVLPVVPTFRDTHAVRDTHPVRDQARLNS